MRGRFELTPLQLFVDSLRDCLGLGPIYGERMKTERERHGDVPLQGHNGWDADGNRHVVPVNGGKRNR